MALASACDGKEPQGNDIPAVKLQVTPDEISVSSDAQEVVLTVTADSDWGVTPLDSWVKTSPTGGIKGETAVKVDLEENKTGDVRQTTLLFKYGTSRFELPVKQHYKVQTVTVEDKALLAALLRCSSLPARSSLGKRDRDSELGDSGSPSP